MNSVWKLFVASIAVAVGLVALLARTSPRPHSGGREPLILFCAAVLKPAVEPVAAEYERTYGVPVQLQYGGSGTLLSNLRLARRGDLFLAADQSYMNLARDYDLVAEILPLAHLTPVLAVRRGNPRNIRSLPDLWRKDVSVALANPDAAAIGRAARDALRQAGVWATLEPRIKVFKPTVNDVANDLRLGTVDAAVVWDATVWQYPELEPVPLPGLVFGSSTVSVGVLRASTQPSEALRFARYLGARDRGLREFARQGYQPVAADLWSERMEPRSTPIPLAR